MMTDINLILAKCFCIFMAAVAAFLLLCAAIEKSPRASEALLRLGQKIFRIDYNRDEGEKQ